jgi:hypothetical protein
MIIEHYNYEAKALQVLAIDEQMELTTGDGGTSG